MPSDEMSPNALPDPQAIGRALAEIGAACRVGIERRIADLWSVVRPQIEGAFAMVEALTMALQPITDYAAEHPEILLPDYGPDPGPCHHACWIGPEHECTGESFTSVAYRPGGRLVPMCEPCRITIDHSD